MLFLSWSHFTVLSTFADSPNNVNRKNNFKFFFYLQTHLLDCILDTIFILMFLFEEIIFLLLFAFLAKEQKKNETT